MKAIVQRECGAPEDVLRLVGVDMPSVGKDVVAGISWGTTLALADAQAHPGSARGLSSAAR